MPDLIKKKENYHDMTIPANKLKIQNLIKNMRYAQQACMSNLLVTVFATCRIDRPVITENIRPTTKIINQRQPAKN
jgi:hypothetical protein